MHSYSDFEKAIQLKIYPIPAHHVKQHPQLTDISFVQQSPILAFLLQSYRKNQLCYFWTNNSSRLLDAGIRKWKAVDRPLLSKKHAAQWLKWAREHYCWTKEQWAKVIWSDECSVKKESDAKKRQCNREKYYPKNIRPKTRDGDISQIVWGCFKGDKLGPIALVDCTVNMMVLSTFSPTSSSLLSMLYFNKTILLVVFLKRQNNG